MGFNSGFKGLNTSLTEYCSGDEIKNTEMGRTRDTYGGDER